MKVYHGLPTEIHFHQFGMRAPTLDNLATTLLSDFAGRETEHNWSKCDETLACMAALAPETIASLLAPQVQRMAPALTACVFVK